MGIHFGNDVAVSLAMPTRVASGVNVGDISSCVALRSFTMTAIAMSLHFPQSSDFCHEQVQKTYQLYYATSSPIHAAICVWSSQQHRDEHDTPLQTLVTELSKSQNCAGIPTAHSAICEWSQRSPATDG